MKLLLHMCCAPCSTFSAKQLRELDYEIQGYFYNPNIHPYQEFRRRLETLEGYCREVDIPLLVRRDYDLENYLRATVADINNRCSTCYRLRLEETAKTAAKMGIPNFSTTLSISPYQNHERLQEVGEAVGKQFGVKFIYEDFRPGYRESVETSKQLGLYRQPYCGCIFSEKDRYFKEGK